MITRCTLFLGILFAVQSIFAIEDGTYRTRATVSPEVGDVILEAKVSSETSEAGSKQFITVRQIQPLVKQVILNYEIEPKGFHGSCCEYGDLVLPYSNSDLSGISHFFVSYAVYPSKSGIMPILLNKADGNSELLYYVNDTYQNTNEEKQTFKEFIDNYKGTLVCEATTGYIYEKGITTYVKAEQNTQQFFLSSYDNNTKTWRNQNIEVALRAGYENIAYFVETTFHIPGVKFEIGVGDLRDFVSVLGDSQASAKFPYSGSFHYQLHNVCKIESNPLF